MKVKLVVKQFNLTDKTSEVVYSGKALLNDQKGHKIVYQEDYATKVKMLIGVDNGYLHRHGEVVTKINFDTNKIHQAIISSDAGDIVLDVDTKSINTYSNNIVVVYTLLTNKEIVNKFVLDVEWEYE